MGCYKSIIISSILIAIIGVILALLLEYKIGIPFYFIGIITILIEILILIAINCRNYERKNK